MTINRNLSFLAEGVSSTGVLGATYGGTGQSSITTGDLLYGSASNTISKLAIGSTGTVLRVVAGVPSWGTDYVGTVTSVAALTLGTTGTDLSSTVANGTTTPVITLNVPTASATNRGVLSSTDWTTFNNKGSGSVTSVAATVPSFLSISGSPITTSGTLAITYSGTALPTANGGTALTSFTTNGVLYATSTSALATNSSLTFDGGGLNIAPTSGVWSLFIASPYSASTSAASIYNGYGSITGSNPQFFVGQRFSSQGKLSFWRYDGGHQANDLTIFNTGGVSIGNTTDPGSSNLSLNQGLFQGSTSPTQRGTMYGVVNINNNSADGTVDFTQGLVFTDNVNNTGAWTHAGICTTGSSGYNGNLIFGTDNDGAATSSITEKMRISASGGVSIGNTTDPGATNLSVTGVIKIGSNQAVNGPAFSAYPSSNSTTFAAGVFTKVILDSTEYNINSNFSSSRFTPTIAGYYQINGQINFSSGSNVTYACIYKNGSRYRDGAWMYSISTQSLGNVSAVIYFNGTTDYVELYGANGNATSLTNINSGVPQGTVFSGVMVRGA